MKEKGESKPRQHTIDLSQMAVPIQLAQEKKTESPRPSTAEAEPSTGHITAGGPPPVHFSHNKREIAMPHQGGSSQCLNPSENVTNI